MDIFTSLIGIWRMDGVTNAQITVLCGVVKGVDERIFHWFGYTEIMKNDRIIKRLYVGVCVVSTLVRLTSKEVS